MKLKSIEFDVDDLPKKINVDLTIDEAAWIAKLAGLSRNGGTNESIYSCLVDGLFNRYWSGGVDDVVNDNGIEIPPIRYDD